MGECSADIQYNDNKNIHYMTMKSSMERLKRVGGHKTATRSREVLGTIHTHIRR